MTGLLSAPPRSGRKLMNWQTLREWRLHMIVTHDPATIGAPRASVTMLSSSSVNQGTRPVRDGVVPEPQGL
jgi:hypothetical protein